MLLQNKLSFFLVLMCLSSIDCQHGQGISHEQEPNNHRVSSRSASIGERSFGQQPIYDFTITQALPSSSIPKQFKNDGQEPQKRNDPGFPSQTSIFYASDDLTTPAPQTRQLPAPQNSDFGPTSPPNDFGQRDPSSVPQNSPSPNSRQAPIHPPSNPTPPTSIISLSRSFYSRAPATFPPLPANAPTGRNAQEGAQQPITPGSAEASMTKAVFKGLNPQSDQPQASNNPAGRNAFQEPNNQQPQFDHVQPDSHETFPSNSNPQGASVPTGTHHIPSSVGAPQPIPHATINTAGFVPPTTYSLGYPPTFLHSPEVLLKQNVPLYAPGYSLALSTPFGYGLASHTEDILLPNSRSIHTISGSLLTA